MKNQEIQLLVDRLLAKTSLSLSDSEKEAFLEKAIPVILTRAVTRLVETADEADKLSLATILENSDIEESLAQLTQKPGFIQAVEVEVDNYATELADKLER